MMHLVALYKRLVYRNEAMTLTREKINFAQVWGKPLAEHIWALD